MHACTIVSRSASAIIKHIEQFACHTRQSLLFSLSPNVAPTQLSSIVENVAALSSTSIGCLTAPTHGPDLITCSMAFFDSDICIPFRSTIPGTPIPQVGRWHAFRKKDEEEQPDQLSWSDVWSRTDSALPDELKGVADVNAVVYFTDSSPQGLSATLSKFTSATRLGLIATSTPFITGRPFTMFYNKKIYDSGAVGFALTGRSKVASSLQFLGLVPLSEPMTVTQSEGNLINTLNDKNPTQLLLSALKSKGFNITSSSFKDDEAFYIMHPSRTQAYTITAGDPSRGTISVSGEESPAVGTDVQFFFRPKSLTHLIPDSTASITFLVSEDTGELYFGDVQSGFVAASENGFVYGDHSICKVPGGLAKLSL